jgi:predicted dehydrogenase
MKFFLAFAFSLLIPSQIFSADLRIGLIGLDTSHVIEFTRRFNDANDKNHVPGGKVVVAFKGGSPDIQSSAARVEGYTKQLQEKYGVKIVDTIEELCEQVDVVMLESVDGRPHLQQAIPVFKAKKPIFIDKPVAGSLTDAIQIFRLAKENNVPCFSSSSLRYYPGLVELKAANVGEIKGAISTGPAHLEPHHPDLFWYGIHPTEALFTIMGKGCESVVRTSTPDTEVVTGVWKGGKVGTLRGLRNAVEPYRVTLFGSKAVLDQKPGGDYTPFLQEVMKFFQTGVAPVSPEETIEIFAFMEAADESKRQGGCPVKISDVMKKASSKSKQYLHSPRAS